MKTNKKTKRQNKPVELDSWDRPTRAIVVGNSVKIERGRWFPDDGDCEVMARISKSVMSKIKARIEKLDLVIADHYVNVDTGNKTIVAGCVTVTFDQFNQLAKQIGL